MYGFSNLDHRFLRNSCDLFREIQGELIETPVIIFKTIHSALDKFLIVPSLIDNVFRDGAQPYKVCAWIGMKEDISPHCHLVFPQIGHNEFLPVQLVGPLDSCCKYRM